MALKNNNGKKRKEGVERYPDGMASEGRIKYKYNKQNNHIPQREALENLEMLRGLEVTELPNNPVKVTISVPAEYYYDVVNNHKDITVTGHKPVGVFAFFLKEALNQWCAENVPKSSMVPIQNKSSK